MNYLQAKTGIWLINITCYFQFKAAAINSVFAITWMVNLRSSDTR